MKTETLQSPLFYPEVSASIYQCVFVSSIYVICSHLSVCGTVKTWGLRLSILVAANNTSARSAAVILLHTPEGRGEGLILGR